MRILIEPLYPMHAVSVVGRELPDGAVELVAVAVSWIGLGDPDEEDE